MTQESPHPPRGDSGDQLDRLERKLDFLTWVVSVQALLMGIVAVSYLMQFAGRIVLLSFLVLPILFIFRRSLPDWARRLAHLLGKVDRWVRSKYRDSQSSPLR